MSNENANLTKVIVPCRFSYLHCWEPNAVSDGDPKYSVSAIIPKSDTETIEKIKRAIEQAKKDSVSKWGGKVPANLKLLLRDGDIDRPEDEAYADSYFFNANMMKISMALMIRNLNWNKNMLRCLATECQERCSRRAYPKMKS